MQQNRPFPILQTWLYHKTMSKKTYMQNSHLYMLKIFILKKKKKKDT